MTHPAAKRDAALGDQLERALPRVRAFARNLAGGDGDDVVQETLARAWRYRDRWDAERDVLPWLIRTAFRVAIDMRRSAARRRQVAETSDPAVHAPCQAELRDEVEHAMRSLSGVERAILLGFHRDGASIEELAGRYGIPSNTVKSHLHRARHKLHAQEFGGNHHAR